MAQQPKEVLCSRCNVAKRFLGTRKFHEGANWGILGDLGELFVHKEVFDVYACPKCGGVEFFVDGIGEELRPN
jgi:Zn finger protein HypA/HybF involved in hydrogenase expression